MTELGDKVDNLQIDKIVDALEKRAVAEKLPAYAELLKSEQVEALLKAGLESMEDIRATSDEDLIRIKGIGLSSLQKLRDWSVVDLGKGDAISRRYLVLKCGSDSLDVGPGDVIPAKFGAKEAVESGKATWK